LADLAYLLPDYQFYDYALKFDAMAASEFEKTGNLREGSRLYHNLAVQLKNVGMNEKSKDAYENALRLGMMINDRHRVGDIIRGLANLTDDDDEASRMLEKSCHYLLAAGAFPCLIYSQGRLVKKYAKMKQFKNAEATLKKLRSTTELWGDDESYVAAAAFLSRKKGKFDQAISLLKKNLSRDNADLSIRLRETFLSLLADTYYDAEKYDKALATYEKIMRVTEDARRRLTTQERKSAYSSDYFTTYETAFDCATRGNDIRKAFEIMEKSRARAFLDLLAEKIQKGRLGISHGLDELPTARKKIPEINTAATSLLALVDADNTSSLPRDLEIVVKSPPVALNSFISEKPVSLDEFQKSLPKDVTVVEYFTTANKLHIWTITSKASHLASVDIEYGKLKKMVETWRGRLLTSPTLGARSKLEGKLYETLWGPVAKLAKTPKIVIIPHRALHSMPFHALRDEKGMFLCETREIRQASSATLLEILKDRRRRSNNTISFGNPFIETGLSLPYSEKEAKTAASYFKSKTFLRGEATETSFKTSAPRAGVIHLACHAFFDKYSPLDSFVLLTRDSLNDGMLKTTEIFNLRLRENPLVVLSACKSAKGSMTDGDDIIGLSTAFFCAGASEVLATLWSVDDKATEHAMRSFYRHFAETRNASDALTAMRRDMLKEKTPLKNWAPFVLLGGWQKETEGNKSIVLFSLPRKLRRRSAIMMWKSF
ncbi:MAG: CHAT domain-containing protein, partial [Kiritimatiellaeota bacterium]|nr:CHAT domain-containing protein [Kiritimatiellota bacterium]